MQVDNQEVEDQIDELPEDQEIESEEQDGEQEETTEEVEALEVSFGEEPEPEEEAPTLVNKLRKMEREKSKRVKELELELERMKAGEQPKIGAKPKLEDFDYDADEFEKAYETWQDQKRQIDAKVAREQEAQEKANQAWQEKLKGYAEQKAKIPVKDYAEAESSVLSEFSEVQQSIIVKCAQNSAMMIYGLGKNPKLLNDLAAIKDPIEFTWKVGQLETKMNTSSKPKIPAPEKTVSAGRPVGNVTRNLDSMREKAEKSGDWTAYFEAKRKSKA